MPGPLDHHNYLPESFNNDFPPLEARAFSPPPTPEPADANEAFIDYSALDGHLQDYDPSHDLAQSGAPEDLWAFLSSPELDPSWDVFGSLLATPSQHHLTPTTSYVLPTMEDLGRALSSRIRQEYEEYQAAQARLSLAPSHSPEHQHEHKHNLACVAPTFLQGDGSIRDSGEESAAEDEVVDGSEGEGSEDEDKDEGDEEVSDYEESNMKGKRQRRTATTKSFRPAKLIPSAVRPTRALPSRTWPIRQATLKTPPIAAHLGTKQKKKASRKRAPQSGLVEGYLCPCHVPGHPEQRCNALIANLDDMPRHLGTHLREEWALFLSGTPPYLLHFGGYPPTKSDFVNSELNADSFICEDCYNSYSRIDALTRHHRDHPNCAAEREAADGPAAALPVLPPATVERDDERLAHGEDIRPQKTSRPPAKRQCVEKQNHVVCSQLGACKVTAKMAKLDGLAKLRATAVVCVDQSVRFYTDRFFVSFARAGQVVRVLQEGETGGRRMFTAYTPEMPVMEDSAEEEAAMVKEEKDE